MIGAGMTLSVGKAADMYGRKKILSVGLLVMAIGLVLCALSHSFEQLLASRFVSAFGVIISMSSATAVATAAFSAQERGKALGIIWAMAYMGLVSGPLIAGVLIDTIGWRSTFYMRVPFVIIDLALAVFLLKKDVVHEHKGGFDIKGAVLLFLAIPALMYVINQGHQLGWTSPAVIMLTVIGFILLGLFIAVEMKAVEPILELRMFSSRFLKMVTGSQVLFYMSTSAFDFTAPFFLIQGLSLPPTEAGLLLVVTTAVSMVISPVSGRLSDRLGTRLLCIIGLAFIGIGMMVLRRFTIGTSITEVLLPFTAIGVGLGFFTPPVTSAIMGAIPREKIGTAAAMINLFRQLGMTIGLAIAGSIYAASTLSSTTELLSQGMAEGIARKTSVVNGMHDTLLLGLVFLITCFAFTVLRARDSSTGRS
jgi:EmrB/QacA subfamily drug resistance transporter